jgi:phage pi2 protein 07
MEDPQLGTWVSRQRSRFKHGIMDQEQEMKLEEIGFQFYMQDKANKDSWDFQFKKLHDYYEKHGHCEWFSVFDRFSSS